MIQGIIAAVMSSILSGIVPTFQKQIVSDGLPLFSMMLFNCGTIELCTFVIARLRGHSLRISRKQLLQALTIGPLGTFLITALLNFSYQYMSVGMATMIYNFYPTVTCILMAIVFKQGLTKLKVAAITVSLAGMVCLTGKGGSIAPVGIILALGAALFYSIYLVGNDKGSLNELPLEVKMFYTSLPSLVIVSITATATHNLALPATPAAWIQILFCSVMGAMVGGFLLLFGIQKLGATTASFLTILNPIVSVVVSTIWFHDQVTVNMVIGSVLILSSVCLITLDNARKGKAEQSEPLPSESG